MIFTVRVAAVAGVMAAVASTTVMGQTTETTSPQPPPSEATFPPQPPMTAPFSPNELIANYDARLQPAPGRSDF
jgi:hypothetical protein